MARAGNKRQPPKLTAQKRRFVDEYITNGRNGKDAAIKARYSEKGAKQRAHLLLMEEPVQDYLEKRVKELQVRTNITQDRVLQELWDIALADPNNLIEYRRVNCRFCWGDNHKYQRTPNEFESLQKSHKKACAQALKDGKQEPEFDPEGGVGYHGKREPNPDCPECFGDGVGQEIVKDTRCLPETSKALYAGVERSKEGLKVKMHPKVQAIELVGRHLGMWNDKIKLAGDKDSPLVMLYEQIKGNRPTIAPSVGNSSLPVHEKDEE